MTTLVYVEFSYGLMRTVVLDKYREKYYVRACHDSVLASTTYLNGVIYNLSSITATFQKVAHLYALKNVPVILGVEKENVLNILQIILSFDKSGLKLYKVMCRALINWEKNMKYASFLIVDAFYYQSVYFKDLFLSLKELKRWWYPGMAVIMLIVITAMIGRPSEQMELLIKRESATAHRNEEVKDALHAYEMLRDVYKHVDKQMNTQPTLLPGKSQSVSVIMRSLSLTICKKTWITSVSMKKESLSDTTCLRVEGKTLLQKEVTHFKQDFERLTLGLKIVLNVLEVEEQGVSTFTCSGVLHNKDNDKNGA